MSKEEGIAFCEKLFAKVLDGHPLISNASHLRGSASWIRFPRVVCKTWVHRNDRGTPVVLMGDAAHTAHFSIGSGTRLAMEDAIALALAFRDHPHDVREAFQAFEAARRPVVEKLVHAANTSGDWYERFPHHMRLPPWEFAMSYIQRSGRIDRERLRRQSPLFVAGYEASRSSAS